MCSRASRVWIEFSSYFTDFFAVDLLVFAIVDFPIVFETVFAIYPAIRSAGFRNETHRCFCRRETGYRRYCMSGGSLLGLVPKSGGYPKRHQEAEPQKSLNSGATSPRGSARDLVGLQETARPPELRAAYRRSAGGQVKCFDKREPDAQTRRERPVKHVSSPSRIPHANPARWNFDWDPVA
jgi:hypothetical protein